MIKINLAEGKQGATASSGKPKAKKKSAGLGDLSRFPIKKVLLPLLVGYVANWMVDDLKTEDLAKVDTVLQKKVQKRAQLSARLAQTKGYEATKLQLDNFENTLITKIQTIEQLIENRGVSYRLVRALSENIPDDVWIYNFKVDKSEIQITGGALDINLVSDFMDRLGSTAYMTQPDLKSTDQSGRAGLKHANFTISAERK